MRCEEVGRDEIAERYILGQLNESEAVAYEEHFFECPRCLSDLQTAQSLREELRRKGPFVSVVSKPRFHWQAWAAIAAAAIVIVGIGWRMVLRSTRGTIVNAPIVHSVPPPERPATLTPYAAKLELLARMEPPEYRAPNLRGSPQPAEILFRQAMELYGKKDYAATLPALEAAAKLDAEAAGPPFFAGICQLLQNVPDHAIANFERVISLGESPYLEKAHFYKAKALLRKGDLAGATRTLDTVIRLKGDLENEARGLNKQVRELQGGAR